jgi:hypothetical protein
MRFLLLAAILMIGLMTPGVVAQQTEAKDDGKASDSSASGEPKERTRNTPFGRVRQDANPQPAPKPEKPSETGLVRAEVKGDTVTFRRKTPFGNQVWTRKRSELSDDEKEILANQSNSGKKPAEAKPAAAPKPAAQPKPAEAVAAKPK